MTRNQIRKKIQDVCRQPGWSIARLSKESGVSRTAIERFSEGRDEVSPQVLYKICQALELDRRS